MASLTSNSTSANATVYLPPLECVPWIILLTTESLLIVVLNLVTVIVFTTQRQLRRKSTYLLIRNLAIVDLLAGAISGPLQIERVGEDCDVWEYGTTSTWVIYLKNALLHVFSMASLGNLVAMSLERAHAIFFPFEHRVMRRWVFKVIIAVIWLIAAIRESLQIVLSQTESSNPQLEKLINSTLYVPYYMISLLLVCVSYISIFIKTQVVTYFKTSRSSAISRERQLTSTLFVVTLVSILTLLPVIIFLSVLTFSNVSFPSRSFYFHIRMIVVMFFLANSLANPVIYSMRMQEFRAGLAQMFGVSPYLVNAGNLRLRHLS